MAPESIRLARLLVSGVASTIDFGLDAIEDLAIAVDELCYLLIGPDTHDDVVRLEFLADSASLRVEGSAPNRGQCTTPSAFSTSILSATLDSFDIGSDRDTISFRMALARRTARPGA